MQSPSAGTYRIQYQTNRGQKYIAVRDQIVAGRIEIWDIKNDRSLKIVNNGHYNELHTMGARGRKIGTHPLPKPAARRPKQQSSASEGVER